MSQQLINLSFDLSRLRDDGYEVSIEHGHLVVRNIPYVNVQQQIAYGILVSTLALAGNQTIKPDTHTIMFSGEFPCTKDGTPIENIRHNSNSRNIGPDLDVQHSFSSKPRNGYDDYHQKVTTYATILSSHAEALNPEVTPRTHRIIEAADDSPFKYFDNASGRAGIVNLTRKLENQKIAIVGLGGTGSYVLDLVAKTPVREVHLFDGDTLEQHNAFRTPGAVPLEALKTKPLKVDYFQAVYQNMHKYIIAHPDYVSAENVQVLQGCDIVFLCIDANDAKPMIIQALEESGTSFIDVGMGLELVGDRLVGTLRTATSTPSQRSHIHERKRVPLKLPAANDIYHQNIQVADLNALNACLAILRWKRLLGFYHDTEHEHFSLFTLDGNHILNEDVA